MGILVNGILWASTSQQPMSQRLGLRRLILGLVMLQQAKRARSNPPQFVARGSGVTLVWVNSCCHIDNIYWEHIQDNIVITNELIGSKIRKQILGFLYKLDFYKAFNCVSWKYLDSELLIDKKRVWVKMEGVDKNIYIHALVCSAL